MEKIYYFDDPEIGLAKKTSHPNFNKVIEDAFYYDLLDDFSPFGNDTGADTLRELSDWIRENQNTQRIIEWMFEYIDTFGFNYKSKDISLLEDLIEINRILAEDDIIIEIMDQAIIATGFGQIKITGKINRDLKEITERAVNRQILINRQILSAEEIDINKTIRVVDGLSTRPDDNGGTNHLTEKYIHRMEIMKKDLAKTN